MGKASKWIRSFLTGKKEKEKDKEKEKNREIEKEKRNGNQPSVITENPTTPIAIPPTTPKEKRRWSFRRSAAKDPNSVDSIATTPPIVQAIGETENGQKKNAVALMETTVATADAVSAATQPAAAAVQLVALATSRSNAVEETAAIKIQSVFRSYLARKALCALKGLVKLQALVRGHLVRKRATATLRCMQALVSVQARARAQRIRMTDDTETVTQRQSIHRISLQDNRFRVECNEMERGMEENIRIVEMDFGECKGSSKGRNSNSTHPQTDRAEHRSSTYLTSQHTNMKPHDHPQTLPSPSALTDMSPRACSGHFEEYSFNTAQSSPQYHSAVSKPDPERVPFAFPRPEYATSVSHDYSSFPNYMANTESSRAKVRSHSAPKQRPDSFERQPSKRRASMEGRNIPRSVRMQRSSSHVGSAAQGYQYPWLIKLDRSAVSLKNSECGSTSTMLTNTNYCRSLAAYELHGNRYQ